MLSATKDKEACKSLFSCCHDLHSNPHILQQITALHVRDFTQLAHGLRFPWGANIKALTLGSESTNSDAQQIISALQPSDAQRAHQIAQGLRGVTALTLLVRAGWLPSFCMQP